LSSLIIIVAMFALLWLLLIRPQRQAQSDSVLERELPTGKKKYYN